MDFIKNQINIMYKIKINPPNMYGGGAPRKNKWVFCYGSNNLEQLRKRVKHRGDWNYKPVVLKGWVRIFCGFSKTWDGGVASILRRQRAKTYGIIVQLNETEIKRLDKYEGVGNSGWYYHETVTVHGIDDDKPYEALTYVKEDFIYDSPPSKEYLEAIYLTLKDAGIDDTNIPIYGVDEMLRFKQR